MIFAKTRIRITDNSGAKWAKCIKALKTSQKKGVKPYGSLVISIRKIKMNKNSIEKGKIFKALLIRGIKNYIRRSGNSISFSSNAITLITDKKIPIASRIIGPVYKELRSKYKSKTILLTNLSI